MGTLRENVSTFITISRWVLRKMRYVSDNICTENQNTYSIFNKCFPKVVPFMEKYGITIQARWQLNTAHALCMLDN